MPTDNKVNKTPLRYPGGKSRAIKTLKEFMPPDLKELCSPFLGGGSFELSLNSKGVKVWGYDLFDPLTWFWKALLENPSGLANIADSFRKEMLIEGKTKRGLYKEDFLSLRSELVDANKYSLRNAAIYYAINRSSFGGQTLSGGFSKLASHSRFNDASIDRIRSFKTKNFSVDKLSFEASIKKHPDTFLYCDPPYYLGNTTLYGHKGNMHRGFDHELLHEILSSRSRWALSYNDCDWVREKYSGSKFKVIELNGKWAYGSKIGYTKEELKKRSENTEKLEEVKQKLLLTNNKEEVTILKQMESRLKKEQKSLINKMGASSELLIISN